MYESAGNGLIYGLLTKAIIGQNTILLYLWEAMATGVAMERLAIDPNLTSTLILVREAKDLESTNQVQPGARFKFPVTVMEGMVLILSSLINQPEHRQEYSFDLCRRNSTAV